MSRRKGNHVVYLYAWDDHRIVKIGSTNQRRWLSFKDGRLVLAIPFATSADGYDFETGLHVSALQAWPRAFAFRTEAESYLGRDGDGYCECYRATAEQASNLVTSQCHVTVQRHIVTSQYRVIDARTYVLRPETTTGR